MTVLLGFAVFFLLSLGIPEIPGFPGEIFWAIAMCILIVISVLRKHGATVSAPSGPLTLWILFLGTVIAASVISHSIGHSILTVLRYLECFTVFILFSQLEASDRTHSIPIIRKAALGAFTLFLLLSVAKLFHAEIPVNALIHETGHHPVSYAAIAFAPFFAFGQAVLPHLILITGVTILSGSRIAILLLGIFLIILSRRDKFKFSPLYGVLIGLLLLSGVLIVGGNFLPYKTRSLISTNAPVLSVFIKEYSSDQLRVSYVEQAIRAIQSYPLTGYGPGTFELISRKFQSGPGQYSRFAHSFPLEFLAENGSVATIFFLLLFGTIVIRAIQTIRTGDVWRRPAAWSIILLSLYAVIDVTMNYLPYLLLYWALAGMLVSGRDKHVRISLLPLGVFFAIVSAGALVSLFYSGTNADRIRLIAAPYRKDLVIQLLSSPASVLPDDLERMIKRLYSHDPDVLFANVKNNINIDVYEQIINIDQYNYSYWTHAFLAGGPDERMRKSVLLCRFIRIHVPYALCDGFLTPRFLEYLGSQTFTRSLDVLHGQDGAAQFLYMVGLLYHDTTDDTDIPIIFWRMARDIAPKWGYFHLELASGLWYWHTDKHGAERVLSLCMESPISRNGCRSMKGSVDNLPHPGTLRNDILAIPRLSP